MLTGVGGWVIGMNWGRELGGEGLCDPLELESARKERSQQVSGDRAGDEFRVLDLRSRRRDVVLPSVCLLPWEEFPLGLQVCLLELGPGQCNKWEEEL